MTQLQRCCMPCGRAGIRVITPSFLMSVSAGIMMLRTLLTLPFEQQAWLHLTAALANLFPPPLGALWGQQTVLASSRLPMLTPLPNLRCIFWWNKVK